MAVMKAQEIQTEEERHDLIGESFVSDVPEFAGVKCVRDITPLVMTALQRLNNPYVTGKKGFEAMGVSFDGEGKQLTDPTGFAVLMMPKTAEVLLLLSCSRDALKQFAKLPGTLEDAALDFVDTSTLEAMAEATVFISQRLQVLSKSRATASPEEDKPTASALEDTGPKPPAPTG